VVDLWVALRYWDARRWRVAALAALAVAAVVAIPTAVIPTPVFGRAVDVTWWSYPTVIVSAVAGGLLLATYVRPVAGPPVDASADRSSSVGLLGGFLTFIAVGCPVCNKLVLLAIGASGAVSWFAPIQPFLAAVSLVLLAVALHVRLGGELSCRLDRSAATRSEVARAAEGRDPIGT
jgi:hypothetical protein